MELERGKESAKKRRRSGKVSEKRSSIASKASPLGEAGAARALSKMDDLAEERAF
jgi:hypothetical protein